MSVVVAPRMALSQGMRRVAIVENNEPMSVINKAAHIYYGPLLTELEQLGWTEGLNLVVERYSGEGKEEQFGGLAVRIVSTQPELIFSRCRIPLVEALKAATKDIPIVTVCSAPVEQGLALSLARPGGNITGPTVDAGTEIHGKRLQLILDIDPMAARVAFLARRDQLVSPLSVTAREAAHSLGLALVDAPLDPPVSEETYHRVFASLTDEAVDGLLVAVNVENQTYRRTIVELANSAAIPAIYPFRGYAAVGGLLSYGPNVPYIFRRAAHYVDNILDGADPGNLPIEQPSKFDLVINLKTARALGIEIPPKLLIQATELIE